MEKSSDGFVRADQIDLKSLDKHLNRAWIMEKNKKKEDGTFNHTRSNNIHIDIRTTSRTVKKERQECEIDPSKLFIKAAIAHGTFGTFHRGIYDGQDVAGLSPFLTPDL